MTITHSIQENYQLLYELSPYTSYKHKYSKPIVLIKILVSVVLPRNIIKSDNVIRKIDNKLLYSTTLFFD